MPQATATITNWWAMLTLLQSDMLWERLSPPASPERERWRAGSRDTRGKSWLKATPTDLTLIAHVA